ncbi:MAG: Crp/Fnr family transcriptional regulator [Candidatus Electrothrix sp. AS4_5]|nr:Crp/Fnr family transcriptional regulator [Candidatus Electrothrix gigas]MCI5189300.1 Crp/Fnr family transcriptional regulator [Candidatus Electrothrix gigas]MCI5226752.1 Crp/Fnr family transcriptional regulator [Candidatus Electrothrix gigas]
MFNKKQLLNQSILFKGLSPALLEQIADLASIKKFQRGESIFFEGDKATGFYMVGQGRVKIYKMSLDGKEQILHIFGPGEPFGEVPVFHGRPFPANAICIEASTMLFFPRQRFIELINSTPSLALSMLAVLSMRLRRFAAQVESLSLKEVPARLAAHLIYLTEEQNNTSMVRLDIPKGQLASLLGTSPETLSRIFTKMSNEGLIRVKGKEIELLEYQILLER